MATKNKQFIKKLSARERAAGSRGGAIPDAIPEADVRRRLADEPATLATNEIVAELHKRVRSIRLHKAAEANRMEPREAAMQAAEEDALAEELIDRLSNRLPEIDEVLERTAPGGETWWRLQEMLRVLLIQLRAGLLIAQHEILNRAHPRGPKHSEWRAGRDAIATCIRNHSAPRMSDVAARALAVDLLGVCGLRNSARKKS